MEKLKQFIDFRIKAIKEAPEGRGVFLVESFKDHCIGAVYFAEDSGMIDKIQASSLLGYIGNQFDPLEEA